MIGGIEVPLDWIGRYGVHMAAKDLYEAINQVQDDVRFLNDNGRRMDEAAMRQIIYALGALTNIVEALVRDEDVPTLKGQRIE